MINTILRAGKMGNMAVQCGKWFREDWVKPKV